MRFLFSQHSFAVVGTMRQRDGTNSAMWTTLKEGALIVRIRFGQTLLLS